VTWVDQSAGGEVLEWRSHFLSREMELQGKPHLAYEPSWRDPVAVKGKLIELKAIPGGVAWSWGGWSRLKLDLHLGEGFLDLGAERQRLLSTGTREIFWQDLPPCDALELTPTDAAGAAGATMRVPRPPEQPWIHFDFHYVFEHPPGLRIVPRQKAWLDRMDLSAVGMIQLGHRAYRRTTPVGMGRDGGFLPLPRGFQGIVAVYGSVGKLRRLLDCTTVFELNERGRPQNPEEWRTARELVGSGDCRARPWPRRSAELLDKIREEALAAGVPVDEVEDLRNVRGLHRCLVLRACPLAVEPAEKARDVRALSRDEDLRALLASLTSEQVVSLVDELKTPAGRLWVLQNAGHPDLAEIVNWAKAAGRSGLDIAKGLVGFRHALQRLTAEVRPGCPEGEEIAKLSGDVDRAVISVQRPRNLEADIGKLEEKVKASRRRAAGVRPITVKEDADWQEEQRRSWTWRSRVDAVLTFCESGEWLATAGPEGEAVFRLDVKRRVAELADRAGALKPAVELPGRSPAAAEAKRLVDLLSEVFEHQHWAPDLEAKDVILSRLSLLVRPDPGRWVTMHAVLREASALAKRWPALATALGVDGAMAAQAPAQRAPRAFVFVKLAEAIPEVVGKWRRSVAGAVPGGNAEALLATPGHPAIEQVYRECVALAERLDRAGEIPTAPPRAPTAPTAEGFRTWWRQIGELLATLVALRRAARDLEGKARFAREELVPRAQGFFARAVELPAEGQPPELAELESAARELAASNGVVTQRALARFTAAFRRVEAWHDER